MSTQSLILYPESLRSAVFSDLTTSFTGLGNPFDNPIRILHIQNLTDANIVYSFDSVTPHGVVASGNFLLLDVTANKTLEQGEFIKAGTHIHIALISGEAAPTLGNVYMTVFYGSRS